jgi:hypothetical protein
MPLPGNKFAFRELVGFPWGSVMTVRDEERPVIYGAPPRPPYREEIQSFIGAELRAQYTVSQELPYRLLIVLMQLKELDRKDVLRSGHERPMRRAGPRRRS